MTLKPVYTDVKVISSWERVESFGYVITLRRSELGLTLGLTADRLGMNILHLSALENDQIPPTNEEIKALAKSLKLDYQYLLGKAQNP
ncbi:MAG TPA: helix-turn-helix transcriptional regulator [Nostocaceae cyanobacterium]|nr:helix-turn-helix transcriptional regulator [Nostocaceae cyanobacterium]